MNKKTKQSQFWSGEFGAEYTKRNPHNSNEMNALYDTSYGVSRFEMNKQFLEGLPKDIRILEMGCNVGGQLQCLQEMGFTNLYGLELQWFAIEEAKKFTKEINFVQGISTDLPFKDGFFDLVYTSGVLIHIHPENLKKSMQEISRCSSKYVWGFEYFAEELTTINYRGNEDFLWKADYAKLYLEADPNLKITKKEMFPYISENEKGNVDCMYFLQKK